jgi:hypothetical protein
MLMNNGPADQPDPTTQMLSHVLSGMFPRIESWRFPLVEIRLYSKE